MGAPYRGGTTPYFHAYVGNFVSPCFHGRKGRADLSIPSRFRGLRHLASDRRWAVPADFQDVQTSRNLKERPGLMAAVRTASENKLFETVLAYRVDLLAPKRLQLPNLEDEAAPSGRTHRLVCRTFRRQPYATTDGNIKPLSTIPRSIRSSPRVFCGLFPGNPGVTPRAGWNARSVDVSRRLNRVDAVSIQV
jgi:hypothetical protein